MKVLVARLNQKTDVGVHEWHGHGDVGTVGQDAALVSALLFDAILSALLSMTACQATTKVTILSSRIARPHPS